MFGHVRVRILLQSSDTHKLTLSMHLHAPGHAVVPDQAAVMTDQMADMDLNEEENTQDDTAMDAPRALTHKERRRLKQTQQHQQASLYDVLQAAWNESLSVDME